MHIHDFSKNDSRHNKIMHSFWNAPSRRLRLRPKDPISSFIVLQQNSIFPSHPIFTFDFVHECEQIYTPSNHVVIYFKFLLQICTKMNGFKFNFSKTFCGREPLRPSPDLSPVFLWLCRPNCFSLRGFDSGFTLNSRLANLPPLLNKFQDPPVLVRVSFGKYLDLLLIID